MDGLWKGEGEGWDVDGRERRGCRWYEGFLGGGSVDFVMDGRG